MLPPRMADVCVAAPVIPWLRGQGVDVASIVERGLAPLDDDEILALATYDKRFVLTLDSDFGQLAVRDGQPFHGVLFVRPGDQPPAQTIQQMAPLVNAEVDWAPPLMAIYKAGRLRLRRP